MIWIILYSFILALLVPAGAFQTTLAAVVCGLPIALLLALTKRNRKL